MNLLFFFQNKGSFINQITNELLFVSFNWKIRLPDSFHYYETHLMYSILNWCAAMVMSTVMYEEKKSINASFSVYDIPYSNWPNELGYSQ